MLILDEIDQLETRTQSVLYKIFEWPSWKKARLVLIGIANAVDLTDRILPRLCAKVELKPTLIHFSPYSKDQIKDILSHRLAEVSVKIMTELSIGTSDLCIHIKLLTNYYDAFKKSENLAHFVVQGHSYY